MSKRILVIDDDEAVRKSFVLALEDTGYLVETTESGEEGLQMARRERYALVFLDLKMPGMNGVETLRALRKIDMDMPVYIVTAFYGEYFDQLRIAREDEIPFQVLEKPVSGDQIVMLSKGVLEQPMAY
jgi:CheY-like chemotaxis protein